MRERDHHPIVDLLVFGTALVLAGVLAYYSWQRFAPRRPQPAAGYYSSQPQEPQSEPDMPDQPLPEGVSESVQGVARIPPVEGTPGKPKRRR